jgi:vitellogenic carboxypeptidase-like protein
VLQNYCQEAQAKILEEDYEGAFDIWDLMLNGDIWPYATYFYNLTGLR